MRPIRGKVENPYRSRCCFSKCRPYAAFVGDFPAWKAAGYPVETGPRAGF